MIKKVVINIFFLVFCLSNLTAQEIVVGLQSNPALRQRKDEPASRKEAAAQAVDLPFFDDFSGSSVTPSEKYWTDTRAFINNTYSDKQITMGMATLDAIDENGKLYETANSDGFEADHLTSQPVNLNLTPSDNVWLSFFYQASGLADLPELKDSLTLQFFDPLESVWHSVWKARDRTSDKFRQVMIRIDDPRYLVQGFQFRFVNYASINTNYSDPSIIGNSDLWNIDYVVLDRNRNEADTIVPDVAFRNQQRSLLKTYEAMPWKQFRQVYLQEMGSSIPIHYRNNDIIVRNVTRNFEIRDMLTNTLAHSFSAGATNIDPNTNVDYNANLIYTYNTSNNDSALFKVTCHLKTDDFDRKENDTIKYYQVFGNYFAYDDGTPEAGYGINGQGSRNAMAAIRFKSYMNDTLRAVNICFNDSYMNSNQRAFNLMIWDDNNGSPGNVIYSVENVIAEPSEGINGFRSYKLPDPVMVDGVFYIGWQQLSETFLNVGFDINTPHKGRQMFWLNGVWQQSQKDGSLMMRPVLGEEVKTTSVPETETHNQGNLRTIRFWPNPSRDMVNIDIDRLSLSPSAFISVTDLQGRELMRRPFSEQLDISSLKPGLYTLIIISDKMKIGYFRLVKSR